MKKTIHSLIAFILLTQFSHANTGAFTSIVKDYQYAVTVEWDQKDQAFLKKAQDNFTQDVTTLLQEGTSPQELLHEGLVLIPNESLRKELAEATRLYENGKLSEKELLNFITDHSSSMNAQGTSWSPALKVGLGLIGGYVVFKLVLLTIMYWDTDPNYGTSEPPPPPPKG